MFIRSSRSRAGFGNEEGRAATRPAPGREREDGNKERAAVTRVDRLRAAQATRREEARKAPFRRGGPSR